MFDSLALASINFSVENELNRSASEQLTQGLEWYTVFWKILAFAWTFWLLGCYLVPAQVIQV